MDVANKRVKYVGLLFSLFTLSACDSYYQKQIGTSYFIRSIDLERTMDIGFGTKESSEGIIDPTVFEVYWNEKYIVVKTHPEFIENRKLTDYYILEKVVFGEKRAKNYMIGPINKEACALKVKTLQLNLSEMEHIVYDALK